MGCPSKKLLPVPLLLSVPLVFSASSGCQSNTWRTDTLLPAECSAWCSICRGAEAWRGSEALGMGCRRTLNGERGLGPATVTAHVLCGLGDSLRQSRVASRA